MKIKTYKALIAMIGMSLIANAGTLNSSIVGFQQELLRQGRNMFVMPFTGVGNNKLRVREFLSGACEGDFLAFENFKAKAELRNGRLHWVTEDGEIGDEFELPAYGTPIVLERIKNKTTQVSFAGVVPQIIRPADAPPERPDTIAAKPIDKMFMTDYLAYSTIQLVVRKSNGITTGTGFFFLCRSSDSFNGIIPVILTNWHVVSDAVETFLTFAKKENDRPTNCPITVRTSHPDWEKWIRHPSNDVDLAALPLLPIINLIKRQAHCEPFYVPYEASLIPNKSLFKTITQLDEAVMIGYPNGLWDTYNLQPIFRRGTLATRPCLDYMGQREFLVDMPVFPGSSGSPILLFSDGPYFDKASNAMITGRRLHLLGVNKATFTSRLISETTTIGTNTTQRIYSQPNDLGIIINASRIREMEKHMFELFPKPQ